jgi:hypothetical protein
VSTVTTLVTRIRRRLDDASGVHWPDTEVIGAVNEAKQDLYDYVFTRNRDSLEAESFDYTWPADTMSKGLSGVLPRPPGTYDIILVSVTPSTDSVSKDNKPTPMRRINFEELYRHGAATSLFYDDYQSVDSTGATVSGSWSGGGDSSRRSSHRWAQQGFTMYVDPIPSSAIQIRFSLLPRFMEYAEDGTTSHYEVFPGIEAVFKRWERIIEYSAALILKGRSDETADPLVMQLQSKFGLLNSWLDGRSSNGTARVVLNAH